MSAILFWLVCVNYLRAEFFRGNINMYSALPNNSKVFIVTQIMYIQETQRKA